MHFPYFTGDVLWGIERLHEERADSRNAGTAVVTHMTVQPMDDDHELLARATAQFEQLAEEFPWMLKYPAATLLQAGQMSLFTLPDRERGSRGAHPDEVDLWSYMYSSAERPGVRVREVIQGDDVSGSYWRFGDAYYAQSGNGPEGDLPGDFKFMYGGAVIRDAISGEGVYAIYGSGWILLLDDDPMGSRIMPPYQGAAGGPSGGPLLTVHDREVDILFLPLGVRPGAILEAGDLFRMAGPIMPMALACPARQPLPSNPLDPDPNPLPKREWGFTSWYSLVLGARKPSATRLTARVSATTVVPALATTRLVRRGGDEILGPRLSRHPTRADNRLHRRS